MPVVAFVLNARRPFIDLIVVRIPHQAAFHPPVSCNF